MSRNGKPKKEQPKELPVELPQLPSGWCWSSVEDVAEGGEQPVLTGPFGSSLGREDFISTGVPLLTIGCLTEGGITLEKAFFISPTKADALYRYRVRPGDLLFSRSASVGRAGLVTEGLSGSVINYHLMRLRLDPSVIDPRLFIYYVRGSSVVRAYLREVNHGATRDGINTTDLLAMPVALPPPKAQLRIVAKIEELFSDLDAGVAALERAKANLKRYRAAVLKAAVEGNLTADWRAKHPKTEPASKLLERILLERRKKWEADQLAKFAAAGKEPPKSWKAKYVEPTPPDATDLTELSEGWCWASMDQLAEIGTGTTPSRAVSAYYENGTIPWIMSSAVNSLFVTEGSEYVTEKAVDSTTLRVYPSNTLIIALYGEGKTRGKVSELLIPATINQALAALTMQGLSADCRPYAKQFLLGNYDRLRRQSAGGMQPNLNLGLVKKITVPLAPLSEQQQIVTEVEERLSQITAAEQLIEASLLRAARLRQSILKQAFQGKLVPQDPHDEPASVLLERIKAQDGEVGGNGKSVVQKRKRKRRKERGIAKR